MSNQSKHAKRKISLSSYIGSSCHNVRFRENRRLRIRRDVSPNIKVLCYAYLFSIISTAQRLWLQFKQQFNKLDGVFAGPEVSYRAHPVTARMANIHHV
jgi:hypothetical protein